MSSAKLILVGPQRDLCRLLKALPRPQRAHIVLSKLFLVVSAGSTNVLGKLCLVHRKAYVVLAELFLVLSKDRFIFSVIASKYPASFASFTRQPRAEFEDLCIKANI